jgi:hypothetical protein
MSYTLPSHISKASTCLSTKFSHFAKSLGPYIYHDFNKFNEFQMLLKKAEKIRIQWLQQIPT